jgi:hypothetical protein
MDRFRYGVSDDRPAGQEVEELGIARLESVHRLSGADAELDDGALRRELKEAPAAPWSSHRWRVSVALSLSLIRGPPWELRGLAGCLAVSRARPVLALVPADAAHARNEECGHARRVGADDARGLACVQKTTSQPIADASHGARSPHPPALATGCDATVGLVALRLPATRPRGETASGGQFGRILSDPSCGRS